MFDVCFIYDDMTVRTSKYKHTHKHTFTYISDEITNALRSI